jgi:hypothetical protein
MSSIKPLLSSFLAVAGASALVMLPVAEQPASAATLNFTNCSSLSLVPTTGGSYNVTCETTTPTPGAPTGCVVHTVPGAPLPNTGGPVSFSASCAGGVTGETTWSWSRSPAFAATPPSTPGPHNETLPAGQATYAYTVNVCNGAACAIASRQIAVGGTTGGGPTTGAIACEGFASTTTVDVPWRNTAQNGGRIETVNFGKFPANGALVLRIAVPAGFTGSAGLTVGEFRTAPIWRQATLSQTPCDFGGNNWFVNHWQGTNLYPMMQVGGAPRASTAQMVAGQVYYLNIRNNGRDGTSSCTGYSSCDMQIELGVK